MPTPSQPPEERQRPLTREEARTVTDVIDCFEGMYFSRFVLQRGDVIHLMYPRRDLDPWAFWKVVSVCERLGTTKPPWVRDGVLKLAESGGSDLPAKKKPGPETDWERDAQIVHGMNWWLHQWRVFRNIKPRRFSLDMASKKVAEEFAGRGIRIQPSTVKSAYRRVRRNFLVISVCESEFKKA
jgi:hypothetical protein